MLDNGPSPERVGLCSRSSKSRPTENQAVIVALVVHSRAIDARSSRVTDGPLSFPIAALPIRSSRSAITEGPLTLFPVEGNDHRDTTQDSDKPKPQASKGSDIQKAAFEYFRMLWILNGEIQCRLAILGSQLRSIHRLLAWVVLGSATGGCLCCLPGIGQAECQRRAASEDLFNCIIS